MDSNQWPRRGMLANLRSTAIGGASESQDVVLLVIDGAIGAFEKGFGENGQTKEHAIMANALGVSQIVVVNKLG